MATEEPEKPRVPGWASPGWAPSLHCPPQSLPTPPHTHTVQGNQPVSRKVLQRKWLYSLPTTVLRRTTNKWLKTTRMRYLTGPRSGRPAMGLRGPIEWSAGSGPSGVSAGEPAPCFSGVVAGLRSRGEGPRFPFSRWLRTEGHSPCTRVRGLTPPSRRRRSVWPTPRPLSCSEALSSSERAHVANPEQTPIARSVTFC